LRCGAHHMLCYGEHISSQGYSSMMPSLHSVLILQFPYYSAVHHTQSWY
jgi:hypothetical protein